MEETMDSKLAEKIERIESQLPRWEKWLYACYSAAFVMLAHAFIKAYENQMLTDALFSIDDQAGATNLPGFTHFTNIYYSVWRILLWLFLQFATLAPAAILAFHPTWRKIPLAKRLDLIGGYLLAAWVALLVLGAQDPLNVSNAYNVFVIVYLLALGLGNWQLRRKKDKAEEVFP
jgi:hypothetical protein